MRKPQGKRVRPAKQRGTWRKMCTSSRTNIRLCFIFLWKKRCPNLVQNPQRSEGLLLIQELLCTCGAKEICVQQKWIRWDDPGPPSRWWQQMVKSKQPRKREHTYMILVCSWLCNYSQKRQQFYRLVSFAKSTDIHMSGSAVKNYGWPKMGRQLLAKLIISYLLSHQVGHPLPEAVRLQHRECKIRRFQSHKIQTKPEVTHQLRETEMGQIQTRWTEIINRKLFLSGCRTSQKIDSELSTKVLEKSKLRKHSIYVHFQKTQIATCAWGPKLQGPHAEDALEKHLFHAQKSLVTWQRRISKSSMRKVNLRTITDMLSWHKILPLSGFSLTRAEPKLLRKRERVYESFSNCHKSQKSFTLTIH